MAVGDFGENLTPLLDVFPTEVAHDINWILTILKAVGIFAIIYLIYMITMVILNWKRYGQLKRLESKISKLDKKLNLLADERKGSIKKIKK